MRRLVDEIVADIRHERAAALARGSAWRARWVCVSGYWALAKAIVLHAATESVPAPATLATIALVAAITVELAMIPIANIPIPIRASRGLLFVYLLPQALAVSVPAGIGIALTFGLWAADRSRRSAVMACAAVLAVASLLNVGWATPAANRRFRESAAGRPVARGANELTLLELRRVAVSGPFTVETKTRMTLWLHARIALAMSPLVLAAFALAAAAIERRALRAAYRLIVVLGFVACYSTVGSSQLNDILGWGWPFALAWLPNAIVAAAALAAITACRSSRSSSRTSPSAAR